MNQYTHWQESIHSEVNQDFISNPYPTFEETISISLRMLSNTAVQGVYLYISKDGTRLRLPMLKTRRGAFDYYSHDFTIHQARTEYHFFIVTPDEVLYYTRHKLTRYPPTEDHDFVILADFQNPDWVPRSVFYQIFPDRFFNGDASNDIQSGAYEFDGHPTLKMDWESEPLPFEAAQCLDFYGGDLAGIRQKLPYLQELGINALYLTPIFSARTSHKYDCTDYFSVDLAFGGDEALLDLINALHERGVYLILDVSINHTGSEHEWFLRAKAGEAEREFYYPDGAGGFLYWQGIHTLPQLNYNSSRLRQIIYQGADSLIRHYLKAPFHADGWRLDVGHNTGRRGLDQFGHEIFRGVRSATKDENPQAYIIGEHWRDNLAYLLGDQWDASMNYFASGRPLRCFAGEPDRYARDILPLRSAPLSGEDLRAQIEEHYHRLPNPIAFLQFNLIDSHDEIRFHNRPIFSFERYKGILILGFLLPGSFSVYYGDEIGLAGHEDSVEGCRYPMQWDASIWNTEIQALYQRLIALKRSESALHYGNYRFLYADDQTVALCRWDENRALIGIASHCEVSQRLTLPLYLLGLAENTVFEDAFSGAVFTTQNMQLTLELPPEGSALLIADLSEKV